MDRLNDHESLGWPHGGRLSDDKIAVRAISWAELWKQSSYCFRLLFFSLSFCIDLRVDDGEKGIERAVFMACNVAGGSGKSALVIAK